MNLRGPVLVCRAFLPAMIERGRGGQIVNVGEPDPDALRRHLKMLLRLRRLRPERVARAIVRALEHGSELMPVGAEAWALHALERLSPGIAARAIRAARRATGI